MSFNSEIKEELSCQISSARHCRIAETAAILSYSGTILFGRDDRLQIRLRTDNRRLARKFGTLLYKGFRVSYEAGVRAGRVQSGEEEDPERGKRSDEKSISAPSLYVIAVMDHEDTVKILSGIGLLDEEGLFSNDLDVIDNPLFSRSCCRRAYLRGIYLAAGAMSNPEKSYHLDIACSSKERAEQLQKVMAMEGITAGITLHKNRWLVYITDSEEIITFLGVTGASNALMNLENLRILKEMRNQVNRQVNCETANITKTVNASRKQMNCIRYLEKEVGLRALPPALAEMARVRLEYPSATLSELGEYMVPPVGKSGVNHRLRKLCELAEKHRGGEIE